MQEDGCKDERTFNYISGVAWCGESKERAAKELGITQAKVEHLVRYLNEEQEHAKRSS